VIYYDRLQHGLREAVIESLPASHYGSHYGEGFDVVWSPSEYPRRSERVFVALRTMTGPDFRGVPFDSQGGRMMLLPMRIELTFSAPVGGGAYVGATGAWWSLGVETGESVSDFRDRWKEILTDPGHSLLADVEELGNNKLVIDAHTPAALYGLKVSGNCSLSVVDSVAAMAKTAIGSIRCEIQVFSPRRYPRGGAMDVASHILTKLQMTAARDVLDSHGIVMGNALPVADLTTLSGATWESRAAITLDFSMRAFDAEIIQTIEQVDGSVIYRTETGDITQTIPVGIT
jgi:hypothetical protein